MACNMRIGRIIFALAVLAALVGVLYLRHINQPQETVETTGDSQVPEPLPEEERQFLWEAEHLGLLLTQYGWNPTLKQLTSASIQTDTTASANAEPPDADFLAEGFECTWHADPAEVDTNTTTLAALVTAKPRTNTDVAAGETLSAADFRQRLQQRIALFSGAVQPHFKLLAVRPVQRDQPEGLWFGRGRITLRGHTADQQPLVCQLIITYETIRPSKKGIEAGGWLQSCQVLRERRIQSQDWLLSDVTDEVGLDTSLLHDNWKHDPRTVNTGGVYLCDFNRDACPDMLVTDVRHFNGLILYQGHPDGTFTDVTVDCDLPRLPGTIDAAFADLDNDGWEDLILPQAGIFRNEQGRRFRLLSGQSNLARVILSEGGTAGLASITGIVVNDYDRDGRVDLYVTRGDAVGFRNGSWIDGKSGQFTSNQLLRNLGDFQFEDVTDETNAGGGDRSVFSAVWLDANLDNWPDVYVINEFGAGLLLVSEQGQRFREVELADESSDFASMGLSCGDFNNDGLTDLYVSNMFSSAGNRVMDNLPDGFYDDEISFKLRRMVSGNQLHLNNGDLTFSGVGPEMDVAEVGWGWGPAVADLNNDGWQDIYATCGFMSHTRANPDG